MAELRLEGRVRSALTGWHRFFQKRMLIWSAGRSLFPISFAGRVSIYIRQDFSPAELPQRRWSMSRSYSDTHWLPPHYAHPPLSAFGACSSFQLGKSRPPPHGGCSLSFKATRVGGVLMRPHYNSSCVFSTHERLCMRRVLLTRREELASPLQPPSPKSFNKCFKDRSPWIPFVFTVCFSFYNTLSYLKNYYHI